MDSPARTTGTRYGVPAYRETVTAQLSEAFGNNMLDQREFEKRLEAAQKAETIEELQAVVADFGAAKVAPVAQMRPEKSRRHFQLMSNHNHVLDPAQEHSYRSLNIMSGTVLDLRTFRGSGATVVVTLTGCMAEYRVKVPRGTRVVREAHVVMGELQVRSAGQPGMLASLWKRLVGNNDPAPPSPYPVEGAPPTVILRGTMVMGTIIVKEDN